MNEEIKEYIEKFSSEICELFLGNAAGILGY